MNDRLALLVAEPSQAWWSTPSEERRQYMRAFYAIPENRAKKRKRQKRYYWRHREQCLDSVRKINFGISAEAYRAMLVAQDGKCAICRSSDNATYKGKVKQLSVDHDHGTRQVRGLLCNACNAGLGHFRNNPEFLVAAARYVALRMRPERTA